MDITINEGSLVARVAVDVARPDGPSVLASWAMPGVAERLGVHANRVYVATEAGGLQIVELTPRESK